MSIQNSFINQLFNFLDKKDGNNIADLTDAVVEIISNTTASFLRDADLVRELIVLVKNLEIMAGYIHHENGKSWIPNFFQKENQLIPAAKINEWRTKLERWEESLKGQTDIHLSSVRIAMDELIDFLPIDMKNTPVDDTDHKNIDNRVAARRQEILDTYDRSFNWLMDYVSYFSDPRSGIDIQRVILVTVQSSQHLSWNAIKNDKGLEQVAANIFAFCLGGKIPSGLDWHSLFGAILNVPIKTVFNNSLTNSNWL